MTEIDTSSLCLQCGLCCDGTVCDNAPLPDEDGPSLLATEKIRIDQSGKCFLFPCPAQQNRICTMYARRFQVCREYKCKLLLQFEEGRISFVDACSVVAKTTEHKTRVKATLMEATGGNDAALVFLYRQLKSSASMSPEIAQTFIDYAALQSRLSKYFRTEK